MLFCMSGSDRAEELIYAASRGFCISALKDINAVKKSHCAATVCILTLEESLASKNVNMRKLCGAAEFLFLSSYVLPHAHKHARLLYIWVKSLKWEASCLRVMLQCSSCILAGVHRHSDSVHMRLKCSFKGLTKAYMSCLRKTLFYFTVLFHNRYLRQTKQMKRSVCI